MNNLSSASERFNVSMQTLVEYHDEFPSLFRSVRQFSAHEMALLGVIHNARSQGITDHHGVWVRVVKFIRKHPLIAVRLANHRHSLITQRYLGLLRDVLDSRQPAVEVARRLDSTTGKHSVRIQPEVAGEAKLAA